MGSRRDGRSRSRSRSRDRLKRRDNRDGRRDRSRSRDRDRSRSKERRVKKEQRGRDRQEAPIKNESEQYGLRVLDVKKEETNEEPKEKEGINLGLSGALTADVNTFNGVVIKYAEPPEARLPKRRWRFYVFKGEEVLPTLHLHRQSAYLIGRDRKVFLNCFFSRESDSTITNVRPSVSLSSIAQNAYIMPIDQRAYHPSSLSPIKPIAHRQSSPLTIKPINLSSSFATFKPFGLFPFYKFVKL